MPSSFDPRIYPIVEATTQQLGLDVGIVSRVVGADYNVMCVAAPEAFGLTEGLCFPLPNCYCSITLAADDIVTLDEVGSSDFRTHPAYAAFGLESYVGIPLRLHDSVYGTLNFSSPTRRSRNFDDRDRILVRAVASAVERLLEQQVLTREKESADRHFHAVFNGSPDAILLHRDGFICEVNLCAVTLLRVSGAEDLVGHPISGCFSQSEATASESADLPLWFTSKAPVGLKVRGHEGTRYFEATSAQVQLEDGLTTVTTLRDVSERHRNLEMLRRTERLATVGGVAAGVAHELNSPLCYALMNLEVAAEEIAGFEDVDTSVAVSALKDAEEGLDRAKSIAHGLLELSSIRRSGRTPFVLTEVIETAIRLSRSAVESHIKVARGFVVNPVVFGDPHKLGQVFLNLFVNAGHAMAEMPGVDHQISIDTHLIDKDKVSIIVLDTGSGFSEEAMAKAFTPFHTTKPQGQGTGLGLSICEATVLEMEGDIMVANRPEGGARIGIILPVYHQDLGAQTGVIDDHEETFISTTVDFDPSS